MRVVKCPKCGRLNYVRPVPREEIDTHRCIRCNEPLPRDAALVLPEPKRVSPVEIVLGVLGVLFWPAGLLLTALLLGRPEVSEKHNVKLGFAWAMMGMVLHLVLFLTWSPMHGFYVQFWTRLTGLLHHGGG